MTTPTKTRRPTTTLRVLTAAALLAVTACSGSNDADPPKPSATSSTSTTQQPTTTPPSTTPTRPLDAMPKVGECFDVSERDFRLQRDSSPRPVPCGRPHTGETFAVYDVGAHPDVTTLSSTLRRCGGEFRRYVGAPDTVSRLGFTLLGPSPEQVRGGATWLRCDVIDRTHFNGTTGRTVRRSFEDALDKRVPKKLIACTDKSPTPDHLVELSRCGSAHTAELVPKAISLGSPRADYPGRKKVHDRVDAFCSRAFQEYVPSTYTYYVYIPTRESWEAGTHASTCWARSETKLGLPPS